MRKSRESCSFISSIQTLLLLPHVHTIKSALACVTSDLVVKFVSKHDRE